MAYNQQYGPPGSYGQAPYAGSPTGAPPGFAAPPGMPAPSPGGIQQFQPPNMPNINFNAPIIRLGVDGQRPPTGPGDRMGGDRGGREGRGSNAEPLGRGNRLGLGADQGGPRNIERQREQVRESMMALQPPTKEEVARTIFIGGLNEGMPDDDSLQQILSCAGKLRRWTRARDADDKKCKFGFAEYEDVESLEAAAEIFPDLEVPLFSKDGKVMKEDGEDGEVKKAKLLVVVDEQSKEYIEQWKGRKKETDDARQFRIESCKEERDQVISRLINESSYAANGLNGHGDADGDATMNDANGDANGAEVVNITLELDDELADIPADMRATVAEEIKAFRDRSNRRDIERLRREEEVEREDRLKSGPPRQSRLASPPPGGPASSANGIPVGPRGQQGVHGAPSGPKGFRGVQMPSDYANGVNFVPGTNGVSAITQDEEDAEESDEELERRRKQKRDEELDRQYHESVRRWQNRERTRGAAQERERKRMENERRVIEKAKEDMLVKLANWNDEEEAKSERHLYYRDRLGWIRAREHERHQEEREDERDRQTEEREKEEELRLNNEARGQTDDFLASMGMGADSKAEQPAAGGFGGIKISLGNAAAKTRQGQGAAVSKRALADVEGLLEDEEDAAAAGTKRPELKPLQDTSTLPERGQDLTDDEKAAARNQLAAEIPTDIELLFAHPIKWDSISDTLIDGQIRPFVVRKVVDYLGVQEDLIVDAIVDGVKNHTPASELADELLGPLEDEAEVLIKKVWRLLVFWGECESRGLS